MMTAQWIGGLFLSPGLALASVLLEAVLIYLSGWATSFGNILLSSLLATAGLWINADRTFRARREARTS